MSPTPSDAKLHELFAAIDSLPEPQRVRLLGAAEEAWRRQAATCEAIDRAREALDDWRLIQKYRVFDMEARGREAVFHDRLENL